MHRREKTLGTHSWHLENTEAQLQQITAQVTAVEPQIDAETEQQQRSIASAQADLQLTIQPTQLKLKDGNQDCLIQAGLEGQADIEIQRMLLTVPPTFLTTGGRITISYPIATATLYRTEGVWGLRPQPGVPPLHPVLTQVATAIETYNITQANFYINRNNNREITSINLFCATLPLQLNPNDAVFPSILRWQRALKGFRWDQ